MKRIISALLILCSTLPAFAQPTSGDVFPPVGGPTDFWHTGGLLTSDRQIRLTYSDTLVLLYKTDGSIRYDTTKKQVKVYDGAYWRRMVDSAYLDTVVSSIEAGAVDTVNYIASITRLDREIDSVSNITDSLYTVLLTKQGADSLLLALQIGTLRDYVDSNNAIIYGNIATLQSDVVVLDSAVGVAFGSISALFDTLPNYVDTAQLNDSLQVIKADYVPYTGATDGVNLGNHSYFADNGVYNSEMSPSYFGVQNDSSTQFSLLEYNQLSVTNSNTGKVMTVNANGITFPDASTQTFAADSIKYSTKAWRQKGVDSVAALIPSLSGYVPYTGATTDVNIGTHNILPNSVRLSTSPTGTLTNVGQLYWDVANVTPSVPLNANVTLQMGQEMYIRAVNKTGVQINDGQVVYVNDAQGNNPTIALANSDSVNTSIVVGVATENIAINGTGFVTTFGIVNGFNTSTFNDGDALYLNTISGQLSNTIPTPPHNVVKVAIALNSTINGKIFVQPSEPLGQDTTFAAPYNSDRVAPTQRSIGTYTRKIVQDTASALRISINAKYGTSDTGRAATNIVTGGSLNKVRDSLAALSGGGRTPISASAYQMLYKSGGDTVRGTTRVRIDTTDLRMEFAYDSSTTTVTTDPHGGVKMWGSNRMGMGTVRINDTVSIPAALQRAINTQITSTMLPTVSGNIAYTNNYVYSGMVQTAGTLGYIVAAWNSTIQHFNYNKTTFTTASGANSSALIRIGSISNSAGIICGNTKFSGGGGRGTFTFSFPTYLATQRIMIGYSEAVSALSGDPSTFLTAPTAFSALMVIKDAADTTLQFAHYSGTGVVTKVNTGIVPNAENVYRLTVYIAPNSTYYMQLEVLSKTSAIRVVTLNPTTNVPLVGDRLVQQQAVNNGTVGGVVVYGLIQHLEEIY